MGASGLVVKKSVLAACGVGALVLIIGAGLIGHYAFPNEKTVNEEDTTVLPTTTIDPSLPLRDFRLPTALLPTHYEVKLTPHINGDFKIIGSVKIHITVIEPTSNITLHFADIITNNDTIKVQYEDTEEEIPLSSHTYDASMEWWVGILEKELSTDDDIILEMDFEGYLNDNMVGFYRSSYVNKDGETKNLAATQFQATDARKAFPCFDEPGLKANFTISLGRETHMKTLSNMPKDDNITGEAIVGQDGWVWDHYQTTVKMSTYLVAFIVSDFVEIEADSDPDNLFSVWVRPGAELQAEYAKEIGPIIQKNFEEYFQIDYVLPKQDMIAIPDFDAGAMENWGLIIYRETAMLYDENISSASDKQWVGLVIVHELAHQWFGNLVTPKWWTDLWLNEGFATYMEYVGLEKIETSWNMLEQFMVTDFQAVMRVDSLESSHPISFPVQTPDEIDEIFDTITYSKGASIIRMMEHFLTNEKFKAGLISYLNKFQYDAAEQNDLWESLTESSSEVLPTNVSVTDIMETWTLQMGFPVLNVTLSEDGTTATVTQNRFLLIPNDDSEDTHDYKWWVPISYTSLTTLDFTQTKPTEWLQPEATEITIENLPDAGTGVIFNIQSTGYYRVNYDDANWDKIIQKLETDHTNIHVNNRAQLIDDAMTLARAGQLNYDIALTLNKYLESELHYVPWRSALTALGYVEQMLTREEAYGNLKVYATNLLQATYDALGFDEKADDGHLDLLKRSLVVSWACKFEISDCSTKAVAAFDSTFDGISPNLKTTVYCTAIGKGSESEWNKAWEKYKTSEVAAEKDQILDALGCSKEAWILQRFLDYAFTENSGIRKQDAIYAFRAVARNDIGNQFAWSYLKSNHKDIADYLGSYSYIGSLISYVANEFNTQVQMDELEAFYAQNSDELIAAKLTIDQAIESVANNIAWMNNNYDVISAWLENYVTPPTVSP